MVGADSIALVTPIGAKDNEPHFEDRRSLFWPGDIPPEAVRPRQTVLLKRLSNSMSRSIRNVSSTRRCRNS
jgi:hypothetical protein